MSEKLPLVSAIVSTYNSEKFIRGKIEDLLRQTIADKLEIVIVNSGSAQDEDSIIKEYVENHRNIIYIHTQERESIYKAWNRGIRAAKGKFITNANTDDRLKVDALEILSNALTDNPEVCLVYADQFITNVPNQKFEDCGNCQVNKSPDFNYLLQLDRCLVFSQPMWRASLHFEDGFWFDEKLEICGDHEFELNISLKYPMLHIPEVLGAFYMASDKSNKSFENLQKVVKEKEDITHFYMGKYLNEISDEKLYELKRIFEKKVSRPFLYTLFSTKAKKYFGRQFYSVEFIFLFLSMILEKTGETERAKHYLRKFLRIQKRRRILMQYDRLTSLSLTERQAIKSKV